MGIDALYMIFHTEKAFGLNIRPGFDATFNKYVERRTPPDFTADEYHKFVCDCFVNPENTFRIVVGITSN